MRNLLQQAVSRALKSGRSEPIDYVSIAIAYAEDAVSDRKADKYCRWIRLAARRFLDDLRRAQQKRPPFYWSPNKANLHCEFIEQLHHVEGTWSSATLKLIPAQIFFVCNLFGFRNLDGGRRFTTALFAVARKNAKSTLASAILLSCLCLEAEQGPQVLSAATTGQQARIVFGVAKRMVERNQELREVFALEAFANAVARYENGGTFKSINSKASTQDGLNPSHTVLDEVHAHKSGDLLNVLVSAAGARGNPLWLFTTTEGYENPGPWAETRNFAQNILERVVIAEHFLACMYMLDEEDDDFDESKWPKANPMMQTNPYLLVQIRKAAIEAKNMPGRLAEFRIKRLNRRSSTASGEIVLAKWRRCARAFDLEDMIGLPCYGGLDLASTTDIAAWRMVWHDPDEDFWYSWGRFWVPEEAVKQRTERNSVNYAGWIAEGYMTQTSGDAIDDVLVAEEILEDYRRFSPIMTGYDSWNAASMANRLSEEGMPLQQFIQGPKSYNPAIRALELAYTRGNYSHGGNKVLTWMAANLVCRKDANLNRAPDKKRAPDKIDGMCAELMAFGVAESMADDGDADGFFSKPVRN